MSNYVLSCCSTADLTKEQLDRRNIRHVCFHYCIDGEEHFDDLGESMSYDEFYARMAAGASTRTSQVNISEYVAYFSEFMEQGLDVVHICLSSGLSGTINSARNAALIVGERYPERKLYIVDSFAASTGYGMLVCAAADQRDKGMDAEQLAQWVTDNRLYLNHLFFSTDLSCYVRGGRISKAAAVFGGMLEICPLLYMDEGGHLVMHSKVRTKRKVMRMIVQRMAELAENGENYAGKCFLSHAGCIEDAKNVAAMIQERFPKLDGDVTINSVGTCIGSHTGPGTIAIYFWGRKR